MNSRGDFSHECRCVDSHSSLKFSSSEYCQHYEATQRNHFGNSTPYCRYLNKGARSVKVCPKDTEEYWAAQNTKDGDKNG
jgi:hypothetical protein